MLPKHMRFDPDMEMHTISQVENPAAVNEDSNSNSNMSGMQGSDKVITNSLEVNIVFTFVLL